jgi:AraC-like DNA-binding protein
MPLVHYYLGRPASVWIAAMSKRSSAPAQVVEADDSPLRCGSGYRRRMEIAELAHLRRARDLLEREYARPLDVPAMARAALMSPSLFSRRFREAYGETPYAYLQARRVERAMGLLREGDLSVTDVCIAVGFTSLGSFSSTFTRLVGEPPSAYKARDHARLAPVPPCMTRAWARPGWIAEPCRIGEALPGARA